MSHKIFISYSHKDTEFRRELDLHLKPLILNKSVIKWSDANIHPGLNWKEEIDRNLQDSSIVLILISVDYINSDSCTYEMERAIQFSNEGRITVIPVPVRACDWLDLPIGRFQAAVTDAAPIKSSSDRDQAWTDVVKLIRETLQSIAPPLQAKEDSTLGAKNDQNDPTSNIIEDDNIIEEINEENKDDFSYQWVRRTEANDSIWDDVLQNIMQSISEQLSGNSYSVRRWGAKIIVDFTKINTKRTSRAIIEDMSGLSGYAGYQIKTYARDQRDWDIIDFLRYRLILRSDSEYFLMDTYTQELFNAPQIAENFSSKIIKLCEALPA